MAHSLMVVHMEKSLPSAPSLGSTDLKVSSRAVRYASAAARVLTVPMKCCLRQAQFRSLSSGGMARPSCVHMQDACSHLLSQRLAEAAPLPAECMHAF